jgi:hypothetical protein
MKRKLRQIGFVFAFFAVAALNFHVVHSHSGSIDKSTHNCALCDTPTIGSPSVVVNPTPDVLVCDVAPFSAEILSENRSFGSPSSRAPPAA